MASGFFMVWNPARKAPMFRHPSRKAATAEAERLSKLQPGDEFFVMEAVSHTRVAPSPPTTTNLVSGGPWVVQDASGMIRIARGVFEDKADAIRSAAEVTVDAPARAVPLQAEADA